MAAMVDWDQSFVVDAGSGSSNAGSGNVDGARDVCDDETDSSVGGAVQDLNGHRLQEFIIGLHLTSGVKGSSTMRMSPERRTFGSRAFPDSVDGTATAVSSSNACSSCGRTLTDIDDVAAVDFATSGPTSRDVRTRSKFVCRRCSTGNLVANADDEDAFPSYENTPLTVDGCRLVADATMRARTFQTESTAASCVAEPLQSPFDSANSFSSFCWTSSSGSSSHAIRLSSSASDFAAVVGGASTGSTSPFCAISSPTCTGGAGPVDVCCRSSTSPFHGGSASQSDSGCSDGSCGGDLVATGSHHFRFTTGPSPIVDEGQLSSSAHDRGDVSHPSPVRYENECRLDAVPRFPPAPIPGVQPPPPSSSSAYSRIIGFLPAWDVERLETVYTRLHASGFYYGRMSIDEAAERLHRSPVGTFLVRDSADERYLFAISVQTFRGTTSIRVAFRSGLFRLDCSPEQEYLMPTFDCVLRLIGHYVGLSRSSPSAGSYVLLETSGRRDTPVLLRTPLRDRVPPLAHCCRRAIHSAMNRGAAATSTGPSTAGDTGTSGLVDRLQLIPSLKRYLKQYPYDL